MPRGLQAAGTRQHEGPGSSGVSGQRGAQASFLQMGYGDAPPACAEYHPRSPPNPGLTSTFQLGRGPSACSQWCGWHGDLAQSIGAEGADRHRAAHAAAHGGFHNKPAGGLMVSPRALGGGVWVEVPS